MSDGKPPEKVGRYEIIRRTEIEAMRNGAELMERFLREAQVAAGLNHPNIITIFDTGEENGIIYIVMECLEKRRLKDYMTVQKPRDVRQAVGICAIVAEALGYAHRKGMVRRDVKPANIMGGSRCAPFGLPRPGNSPALEDSVFANVGGLRWR